MEFSKDELAILLRGLCPIDAVGKAGVADGEEIVLLRAKLIVESRRMDREQRPGRRYRSRNRGS
jgi:hypothetical protein